MVRVDLELAVYSDCLTMCGEGLGLSVCRVVRVRSSVHVLQSDIYIVTMIVPIDLIYIEYKYLIFSLLTTYFSMNF